MHISPRRYYTYIYLGSARSVECLYLTTLHLSMLQRWHARFPLLNANNKKLNRMLAEFVPEDNEID